MSKKKVHKKQLEGHIIERKSFLFFIFIFLKKEKPSLKDSNFLSYFMILKTFLSISLMFFASKVSLIRSNVGLLMLSALNLIWFKILVFLQASDKFIPSFIDIFIISCTCPATTSYSSKSNIIILH